MCALRWDDSPSPLGPAGMPVPVSRVPRAATVMVWLQGPFKGLWLHYVKRQKHPCKDPDCPHCATVPAHWYGYAPAKVWHPQANNGSGGWRFAVFEVTEKIREIKDRLDLVGRVVVFGRRGKKVNGALYYELAGAQHQPKPNEQLCPFPVMPIVELLFDLPGRHLRPPPQQPIEIPADPQHKPEHVQAPEPPLSREEIQRFVREKLLGGHTNGHTSP